MASDLQAAIRRSVVDDIYFKIGECLIQYGLYGIADTVLFIIQGDYNGEHWERLIEEYIGIGYDLAEIFGQIININGKPIYNEYHDIQIFLE